MCNKYKICNACLEDKCLDSFNKSSLSKDGYNWKCRECIKHSKKKTVVESEVNKFCRGCNQNKSVSSYTPNKASKDGLNARCRECVKSKN